MNSKKNKSTQLQEFKKELAAYNNNAEVYRFIYRKTKPSIDKMLRSKIKPGREFREIKKLEKWTLAKARKEMQKKFVLPFLKLLLFILLEGIMIWLWCIYFK